MQRQTRAGQCGWFALVTLSLATCLGLGGSLPAAEVTIGQRTLRIPDGFEIELVAGPPQIERPISVARDDLGRLYVTDSAGMSDKADKQLATKPHRIVRLQKPDEHGRYIKGEVFAARVMFPEGCLWVGDSLYVAAPPEIWRFPTGGQTGELRSAWFNGKTLTGCGNDLHGPYLGRDGWFYWCKGAFAEQKHLLPGDRALTTRASHIFRSRPDGSQLESVLTGGMDNPVGVAFLSSGERVLSCTFFQHPEAGHRDGLIHAIYGGVYGKDHDVLTGHPKTGELMPVLHHAGAAAPCGITSGSEHLFGGGYGDHVFACYFNLHKVVRHVLEPTGASFRTRDEDLVACDHPDFHPTDVLEDADGSLLVVDTGGWYKVCCPTSQLAKPDVLGAIYRLRKRSAPVVADPLGERLSWEKTSAQELAERLTDGRLFVERRATAELRKAGPNAVGAIAKRLAPTQPPRARLAAVWTLAGIEGDAARALLREALDDSDVVVRQAAIHAVGLARDPAALSQLTSALSQKAPAIRRAAAEAIGRLRDPRAIPALLAAAGRLGNFAPGAAGGPSDDGLRIEEHSLIYALIEIGDAKGTAAGLSAEASSARRAALIAIDQMPGGNLKADDVIPLLTSKDPILERTAVWLVAQHAEWGGQLVTYWEGRLKQLASNPADQTAAAAVLARQARSAPIQSLLAAAMRQGKPLPVRQAALAAMRDARLGASPASWLDALAAELPTAEHDILPAMIAAARQLPPPKEGHKPLTAALRQVAAREALPRELRLAALSASASGSGVPLERHVLTMLLSAVAPDAPLIERSQAAAILAGAQLSAAERDELLKVMPQMGPAELARVLPCFEKEPSDATGQELVKALSLSSGLSGVRSDQLKTVLEKYSPAVKQAAQPLLARIDGGGAAQVAKFEAILRELPQGDARHGHELFTGRKAGCQACHVLGYHGGRLGPDLTNLGKARTQRDLAEAICFPSASLVRGYETMSLVLNDGRTLSGIIKSEGADELTLAVDPEKTVQVARSEIEEMRPSPISLMPQGMAETLSRQELADLIAFLLSAQR